jgi:hypothetical protein
MKSDGIIALNGEQIGTFKIHPGDMFLATIDKRRRLKETLEFAADNGLVVSIQLTPEFINED